MATFRLRVSGTWNGGETWTFGLHGSSAASVATVADALQQAASEMWSGSGTPTGALNTLYSDDVIMTTMTAAELDFATGRQLTRADRNVSAPGVATADSLPPQCAVVISLRTELAQAGGRGRWYFPSPALTASAGGRIAPAAQAIYRDASTRFIASLKGSAITPVVYRRPRPTFPAQQLTVTSSNVGNVFDTQRSRRQQLTESRMNIPV